MNQKAQDRAHAIETLRKMLKPGDTVTTNVLHVSRSGMSRVIMCQAIAADYDGKPYISDISGLVADAIGDRYDSRRGGIVVGGCGMNMCFATVYNLGRVLFPNGFAPSEMARNPSKGIMEPRNVNVGRGSKRGPFALDRAWVEAKRKAGWEFTRGRNGGKSGWDNDGGYALNYR